MTLQIVEAAFEGATYSNGIMTGEPKLIIIVRNYNMLGGKRVQISGIPGWHNVLDFTHANLAMQGVQSWSPQPFTIFAINRPPSIPLQALDSNIVSLVGRSVRVISRSKVGGFLGFGGRVPQSNYKHDFARSSVGSTNTLKRG